MAEKEGFDLKKITDKIRGDRNLSIVAGGAVAVFIGLFLPWYSIEFLGNSIHVSPGLGAEDGTGIFLLFFAVSAVLTSANVFNQEEKNTVIAAIVAGVFCALIVLRNWPDGSLGDIVSLGVGYMLCAAGSVAIIAGATMRRRALSAKPASDK